MRIGIVGKFKHIYDEEYIARSFESLGHDVIRFEQGERDVHVPINFARLDLLVFTKWDYKKEDIRPKSVCWIFDLYWGYAREPLIKGAPFFKADYVFTTDGGHEERWKELGINHQCVRQGIYDKECYMLPPNEPQGIVFIGSHNPAFPERKQTMNDLSTKYSNFKWYGKNNTHNIRGPNLNILFSQKKIVVGDSVYSPHYWSNRVVETLGRGGFLIHRDVPGIKEEYPDLVTYDGTLTDLYAKIDYFLSHEDERLEIVRKNFELVKSKYTMDKKCAELLSKI